MFDIGAGELLIIGVVALVVIGPKELPGVLRQVGKATARMRQMAGEFRAQFDEAMREAELEDAKKHITGIKDQVAGLNPLTDLQNEIHSSATMLNAPYTPVETASPIAPLDVKTLPTVAANDSEAVKPKPARKKPAAKVSETGATGAAIAPADGERPPAEAPKPARKRTTTVRPAVAAMPENAPKKVSPKPAKTTKTPRPALVASVTPDVGAAVDPTDETRYAAKTSQAGKS